MASNNLGEAYVSVRADTKQFSADLSEKIKKDLGEAERTATSFKGRISDAFGGGAKAAESFRKALLPAIAALGGLGAVAFKAAGAASDLAEEQAKAGEIFGEGAEQLDKFAASAASVIGQSQRQALAAASSFGIFGKSAGLAGSDLVKFSQDFTVLASDLASFNNTSPEDAIVAIGAALRGESEPIRRYGVLLDDATLRQQAFKMGITDSIKQALTPQQRVLAASEQIFLQTATAQGDFARTSDGLANSQRILAAEFQNAQVSLGQAFLPIILKITTTLTSLIKFMADNTGIVIALGAAIAALSAVVIGVNVAMKVYNTIAVLTKGLNTALGASFTRLQVSLGVIGAVLAVATTAYFLLNGRKRESVDVTNDLALALQAEGDAQKQALAAAVAANPAFGGLLDTLTAQGVSLQDLEANLRRGRDGLDVLTNALYDAFRAGTITAAQQNEYAFTLKALQGELTSVAEAQALVNKILASQQPKYTKEMIDKLRKSFNIGQGESKSFGSGVDKAAQALEKLRQKAQDARTEISNTFDRALLAAKDRLDAARQSFEDFASSIGQAITTVFNFGNAQQSAVSNVESLTSALADQAAVQQEVDDATARAAASAADLARAEGDLAAAQAEVARIRRTGSGLLSRALAQQEQAEAAVAAQLRQAASDSDALSLAQQRLADATDAVMQAQKQPMTFFEQLNQQASQASRFGSLVSQLIERGLSETALQQVLDAGVEAGTSIAEELLSGADNTLINEANRLSKTMEDVAALTGSVASNKFRSEGVRVGEALVAGINQAVTNFTLTLKSKALTAKQIKKLQKDFAVEVGFNLSTGALPAMANGAIVRRPTTALIGESGAEVVVPITRPARALELLETSGLAALARANSQTASVSIQNATFVQPTDVDLLAQKVNAAAIARSL